MDGTREVCVCERNGMTADTVLGSHQMFTNLENKLQTSKGPPPAGYTGDTDRWRC